MPKQGYLISTCMFCHGQYEGGKITIGQRIECPHCRKHIDHNPHFGNYILRKRAGEGGMCTVYLAHDTRHKREVALKLLNQSLMKDMDSILQFFEEAETTGIFEHPNVIKMYDYGEHLGKVYLGMEYLPGGSLQDRMMKQVRVPELDALEIGIGAASGLAHAAKKGIVHRDVKPGNILFTAKGEAIVADFGLCVKASGPNPNTNEVWGTAYYVPPERLFGDPEDFRSDMYGLAATLFHAMTGRAAFESEGPDETRIHTSEDVVRIQDVYPEISNRTAYAIDRAMSFNPRDRFQSYDEFIAHLKESLKAQKPKTCILTALRHLLVK